ncbi:MAG TPA: cupin domain-containing protein [Acidobacteriaceae bacterium]|jgi:predicted cupin superfamily sugar epimerase|nr:cupin domain-containing protein [Acidobacteriaceae bacterium]
MTADEVKKILGLVKHPREGGWYVRTWESEEFVAASCFEEGRYEGARRTSTAIYYLLEPGTFSEMHVLKSDEIFHHYMGGAVEMLQLFDDGRSEQIVIGKDLEAGERPQHVVRAGVWQGSRLLRSEGWALLGCTVSPGFEFVDYEDASAEELVAKWPGEAEMIRWLTNR